MARRINEMPARLDSIQRALGRIELRQIRADSSAEFASSEFQVYSQWGEDGLIQYLLARVPIERPVFVEFGVETYAEANTRFLLQNDNWAGLVIDGSEAKLDKLRSEGIYWRHNVKARTAFVDASNINRILESEGVRGDIGLLSVDIDGNDYWVWQAITTISPRIVICEFNALFGRHAAVSIPYEPAFDRASAHFSHLYYGTSLSALEYLGGLKGYSLVGTNRNSNNAFFVRNDLVAGLRIVTAAECFREAQFREARDSSGGLLFLTQAEARSAISGLEVVDVRTMRRLRVADVS